jgi:hypothetical protein
MGARMVWPDESGGLGGPPSNRESADLGAAERQKKKAGSVLPARK